MIEDNVAIFAGETHSYEHNKSHYLECEGIYFPVEPVYGSDTYWKIRSGKIYTDDPQKLFFYAEKIDQVKKSTMMSTLDNVPSSDLDLQKLKPEGAEQGQQEEEPEQKEDEPEQQKQQGDEQPEDEPEHQGDEQDDQQEEEPAGANKGSIVNLGLDPDAEKEVVRLRDISELLAAIEDSGADVIDYQPATFITDIYSNVNVENLTNLLTDIYPDIDDEIMIKKMRVGLISMLRYFQASNTGDSMGKKILQMRGLPDWLLPIVSSQKNSQLEKIIKYAAAADGTSGAKITYTEPEPYEPYLAGGCNMSVDMPLPMRDYVDFMEYTGNNSASSLPPGSWNKTRVDYAANVVYSTKGTRDKSTFKIRKEPGNEYQTKFELTRQYDEKIKIAKKRGAAYATALTRPDSIKKVSIKNPGMNRTAHVIGLFERISHNSTATVPLRGAGRIINIECDPEEKHAVKLESVLTDYYTENSVYNLLTAKYAGFLEKCHNVIPVLDLLRVYHYELGDIDIESYAVFRKIMIDNHPAIKSSWATGHTACMAKYYKDSIVGEEYAWKLTADQGITHFCEKKKAILGELEQFTVPQQRTYTDVTSGATPKPRYPCSIFRDDADRMWYYDTYSKKYYSKDDYEEVHSHAVWDLYNDSIAELQKYQDPSVLEQECALAAQVKERVELLRNTENRKGVLGSLSINIIKDLPNPSAITEFLDGLNIQGDMAHRKLYKQFLDDYMSRGVLIQNGKKGCIEVATTGEYVCCVHFMAFLSLSANEVYDENADFVERSKDGIGGIRCKHCGFMLVDADQEENYSIHLQQSLRAMYVSDDQSQFTGDDKKAPLHHFMNQLYEEVIGQLAKNNIYLENSRSAILSEAIAYIETHMRAFINPYGDKTPALGYPPSDLRAKIWYGEQPLFEYDKTKKPKLIGQDAYDAKIEEFKKLTASPPTDKKAYAITLIRLKREQDAIPYPLRNVKAFFMAQTSKDSDINGIFLKIANGIVAKNKAKGSKEGSDKEFNTACSLFMNSPYNMIYNLFMFRAHCYNAAVLMAHIRRAVELQERQDIESFFATYITEDFLVNFCNNYHDHMYVVYNKIIVALASISSSPAEREYISRMSQLYGGKYSVSMLQIFAPALMDLQNMPIKPSSSVYKELYDKTYKGIYKDLRQDAIDAYDELKALGEANLDEDVKPSMFYSYISNEEETVREQRSVYDIATHLQCMGYAHQEARNYPGLMKDYYEEIHANTCLAAYKRTVGDAESKDEEEGKLNYDDMLHEEAVLYEIGGQVDSDPPGHHAFYGACTNGHNLFTSAIPKEYPKVTGPPRVMPPYTHYIANQERLEEAASELDDTKKALNSVVASVDCRLPCLKPRAGTAVPNGMKDLNYNEANVNFPFTIRESLYKATHIGSRLREQGHTLHLSDNLISRTRQLQGAVGSLSPKLVVHCNTRKIDDLFGEYNTVLMDLIDRAGRATITEHAGKKHADNMQYISGYVEEKTPTVPRDLGFSHAPLKFGSSALKPLVEGDTMPHSYDLQEDILQHLFLRRAMSEQHVGVFLKHNIMWLSQVLSEDSMEAMKQTIIAARRNDVKGADEKFESVKDLADMEGSLLLELYTLKQKYNSHIDSMKLGVYKPFIPELYSMSYMDYKSLMKATGEKGEISRDSFREFIQNAIKLDIIIHIHKIISRQDEYTDIKGIRVPQLTGNELIFVCLIAEMFDILTTYHDIIDPDRTAIDKLYEARLQELMSAARESRKKMKETLGFHGQRSKGDLPTDDDVIADENEDKLAAMEAAEGGDDDIIYEEHGDLSGDDGDDGGAGDEDADPDNEGNL